MEENKKQKLEYSFEDIQGIYKDAIPTMELMKHNIHQIDITSLPVYDSANLAPVVVTMNQCSKCSRDIKDNQKVTLNKCRHLMCFPCFRFFWGHEGIQCPLCKEHNRTAVYKGEYWGSSGVMIDTSRQYIRRGGKTECSHSIITTMMSMRKEHNGTDCEALNKLLFGGSKITIREISEEERNETIKNVSRDCCSMEDGCLMEDVD